MIQDDATISSANGRVLDPNLRQVLVLQSKDAAFDVAETDTT